jgi:hypothetical protein
MFFLSEGSLTGLTIKLPTIWRHGEKKWEDSKKRKKEKKREDQRRGRLRRKKMQVREKK